MERILIIEDEVDIAELISFNLKRHQYDVHLAHDGVEGLKAIVRLDPHLIVLDLMIPKMDGFQVLKELRNNRSFKNTPVLMLTAKAQTEDRIHGLEQGVDDYMTKPFSPKELVLRVKSILKRSNASIPSTSSIECQPFSFDTVSLQFFANKEYIDLTSTEFKLMLLLCKNANIAQDRQTLLTEVWGYHEDVNSRTLDTHMKRLRQKLGSYAKHLQTVRGIGYKFVPTTSTSEPS